MRHILDYFPEHLSEEEADPPVTVVYTALNTRRRTELLQTLYKILTDNPDLTYSVESNQVNKLEVYHNLSQDARILIRTYLIIIIPVQVNLEPLTNVKGTKVYYRLDETITQLQHLVTSLELLEDSRDTKGEKKNGETFRSLAKSVRRADAEH